MTLEKFLELYLEIRRRVDANAAGQQMRKSVEGIRPPNNADELANILVQVILSSGFSYRNAMRVWDKIEPQMDTDQPLDDVLHPLKRSAIEMIRRDRLYSRVFRRSVPLKRAFNGVREFLSSRGPH